MYLSLFFISGVLLFYTFLFFPYTSVIVALSAAAILLSNNTALSGLLSLRFACLSGRQVRNPSELCGNEEGFTPSLPVRQAGGIDGKRGLALFPAEKKRFFLIIPLILGFVYAFFRYSPPFDHVLMSNKELVIACSVNGLMQETASGKFTNRAVVESAADMATGKRLAVLEGREVNIASAEELKQGCRYELEVKTRRGGERLNPGMAGYEVPFINGEMIRKVEIIKGNPLSSWLQLRRERLYLHLKKVFDSDSSAFLSSVTIGETSGMSRELKTAFSVTGLAHLLSISGTHFGLFSMIVFGIFRLLMRSVPYKLLQRVTIFVTPSQAAAMISLPVILIYLLISGLSIPALRSFIMINIFLFGLLFGRKGFWLNSLLLAALLICLWDPSSVTNISFQLSFLAVLFIGFFVVEKGKEGSDAEVVKGRRILRSLTGSLRLSLAASLGTAPLVAYYFHYFSVISPLANLIVTPLVGFILVPLSVAAAFVFIFTGHYPFHSLLALATGASIKGIHLFAALPFADIKMPAFSVSALVLFYSGLLIYLFSGRKRSLLLVPLAALILCFLPLLLPGVKDLSVTYLDVGQGDSAVVETSAGKVIVIDTGRTGRELEGYLRYLGRKNIDALAVTHADDDHAAGVPYIMNVFPVKEVWDNGLIIYPEGLLKGVIHRRLERGDKIQSEGLAVYILHPYKGFYTFAESEATEENNDSLVLKLTGQSKSFLFAADAAGEAEEDMVHLNGWLRSDVLKIGHHGSRTSSTEDFISAVSPEFGVVSAGMDNPYGHPHQDTLERFRGIRIFRTDRDGAIKVVETASGLEFKTFREFRFERAGSVADEWKNIKRLFKRW